MTPSPTELTRPIIGIENRTAQEVFDIMCDRTRSALVSAPALPDAMRARLAMARGHLSNIEAHGNAEANAVLVIRNVLAELEAALAASHMPVGDGKPTHRHKKRGTEYVLIGIGKMQAEHWLEQHDGTIDRPSSYTSIDMCEVAIYRSVEDGSLWARPREEFEDGRFEPLAASTGEAGR